MTKTERNLAIFCSQASNLRMETHRATTIYRQVKGAINGLSFKIVYLCGQVKDLRATISVTSLILPSGSFIDIRPCRRRLLRSVRGFRMKVAIIPWDRGESHALQVRLRTLGIPSTRLSVPPLITLVTMTGLIIRIVLLVQNLVCGVDASYELVTVFLTLASPVAVAPTEDESSSLDSEDFESRHTPSATVNVEEAPIQVVEKDLGAIRPSLCTKSDQANDAAPQQHPPATDCALYKILDRVYRDLSAEGQSYPLLSAAAQYTRAPHSIDLESLLQEYEGDASTTPSGSLKVQTARV
ncbi:hypothetical protein BKA93DRAFT_508124 [Sparassis latifolia]